MLLRNIAAVGGAFFGLLALASAAEREAGPPVERHVSDVALPVDAETLNRQYLALSSMPSVKVVYSNLGPVRSVEGETGIVLSGPTRNLRTGQSASEVLQKFKDVLLATGTETLKISMNDVTGKHRYLATDQFINGIPVLYGSVSMQIEEATGLIEVLGANFLPDRGLPRQPKISEAEAVKRVEQHLVERRGASPGSVESSTPTLAYHGTFPGSTRGRLVWVVQARWPVSEGDFKDGFFWIDAIDGDYVGSDAASKEIGLKGYSANNAAPAPENFPNGLTLLFNHPGSSPDQTAMKTYNNLLDSIAATQVVGWYTPPSPFGLIVHYSANWTNARYSRKSSVDYLRFGDGSVAAFIGPLGNSRDVVAHEFGHSVARALFSPFGGDTESAAIDEAFGDVTAAIVDVYKRAGIAASTWTIAEIYTNDPTRGLRSMSDPKSMEASSRDWYPARLTTDIADNTRHVNSTIMSHAFKLLVTGGFHARQGQPIADSNVSGTIPSLFVPALGHDKTWQIFFQMFRRPELRNFADFMKAKAAAEAVAYSLYGAFEADAVDRAFRAVALGTTAPLHRNHL